MLKLKKNNSGVKRLTFLGHKAVEIYNVLIRNILIFLCSKPISDITVNLSMLVREIEEVVVPVLSPRWTSRYPFSVLRDKTFIIKEKISALMKIFIGTKLIVPT